MELAFTYALNDQVMGTPHRVIATSTVEVATVLGHIDWSRSSGLILDIHVTKDARRQGVATALLAEARRVAAETRGIKPPRMSPHRTNDGEAFARSLGVRLPRRIVTPR